MAPVIWSSFLLSKIDHMRNPIKRLIFLHTDNFVAKWRRQCDAIIGKNPLKSNNVNRWLVLFYLMTNTGIYYIESNCTQVCNWELLWIEQK